MGLGATPHLLFYADDGLVASTDPVCLWGLFSPLTRLSDRVGFRKHFGQRVGMLYHPCCAVRTQPEAACER